MRDGTTLRVRRDELLAPDLWPTCPRCLRLCDPGSRYCCEDGTRLLLSDGEIAALRPVKAAQRLMAE